MERMILARVQCQLDKGHCFHHYHTGFRQGLSIQENLLMLHHDVLVDPSSIRPMTIVTVDVHKTFDSVPHSWVMESAALMGIRSRDLNFINSFLQARWFQTKFWSILGPESSTQVGVSQGAVLSPTFFNVAMARLSGISPPPESALCHIRKQSSLMVHDR